jgi:hypothetical protein
VMNGTGAYNQATDTASALSALGFHTRPSCTTAPPRGPPRPQPRRWPVR